MILCFLLCQRLGSAHSSHHKCSRCVLAGSQCNHSRCEPQVCKECQDLDRFLVPEAFVKSHPEVCLDNSNQGVQVDPVRELEGWAKPNKCVVLEQCRDRDQDQPTSFNRMYETSLHKDILGQCPCSHKNKCHRPSTFL